MAECLVPEHLRGNEHNVFVSKVICVRGRTARRYSPCGTQSAYQVLPEVEFIADVAGGVLNALVGPLLLLPRRALKHRLRPTASGLQRGGGLPVLGQPVPSKREDSNMKRSRIAASSGLILIGLAGSVDGEAAWTRDGDCMACHTSQYDGFLDIFDDDGTVNPSGHGEFKVFRVGRGQTRSLGAAVGGLQTADKYSVAIRGFRFKGVTANGTLTYNADCDWADWQGSAGTFSFPDFFAKWPAGPTVFNYEMNPTTVAPLDYYDLTCILAGRTAAGDLFYDEEHFYVQVTTPNVPPTVSITSPADNTMFPLAPVDITITAGASDSDGSIVKVQFYVDGVLLGEDTTAPYAFTWLQAGKGNHILIARAMDNGLVTSTSVPVHITVQWIPGDFDGDRDVDQADFGFFQRCLGGPAVAGLPCADADLNADTIVDNADTDLFEQCASGPQVPGSPDCLD